jgi:hypothetical protein
MLRKSRTIGEIARRTELIETILLVRDPGASMAAQAYEGLRRAIIDARQVRQQHVVHLAQIGAAVHSGASHDDLNLLLRDLLAQAAVTRIDEPHDPNTFDISGEGEVLTVIEPAYVDAHNGSVIRQGRARASVLPVALRATMETNADDSRSSSALEESNASSGEDGR